jgi:hypothetical protein
MVLAVHHPLKSQFAHHALLLACGGVAALVAFAGCGGGSAQNAPALGPTTVVTATLADVGRELSVAFAESYRVKYRALVEDSSGRQLASGFLTESKDGQRRLLIELRGDLSGTGMNDADIIVDGDDVIVCSSVMQVTANQKQDACFSGGAAADAAGILVAGVGLPLKFSATSADTTGLTLVRASTSTVLGGAAHCYTYAQTDSPRSGSVDVCFSARSVPVYRRFPVGDNVVELSALEVGTPLDSDFVPPYPISSPAESVGGR